MSCISYGNGPVHVEGLEVGLLGSMNTKPTFMQRAVIGHSRSAGGRSDWEDREDIDDSLAGLTFSTRIHLQD